MALASVAAAVRPSARVAEASAWRVASRLGLVTRLAPAGEALEAARALAAEIIAVSPTSVRLSLQTIEDPRGIADEIDAVRHDTDALDQLLISQDTMEGIMAFAEKRPPRWLNR